MCNDTTTVIIYTRTDTDTQTQTQQTQTQTQTPTLQTKAILRNQAHAWFKNPVPKRNRKSQGSGHPQSHFYNRMYIGYLCNEVLNRNHINKVHA